MWNWIPLNSRLYPEHTKNLGHSFDWEKVKILDSEHFFTRDYCMKWYEMIPIKEKRYQL